MRHIDEMKLSELEEAELGRSERKHLKGCTYCQGEVEAFSQLRASLGALQATAVEPDAQLLQRVLDAVAADRNRFGLNRKMAGTLAVAAGLTGAVILGRQKLNKAA